MVGALPGHRGTTPRCMRACVRSRSATGTQTEVSTPLLATPVMTAAIGAWITYRSWDHLQLGAD